MDDVPAVFLQTLGLVGAVEEFALKELHGDDSEDEHEEDVDDEDVENVLQRVYHTVKDGLEKVYTNTKSKYTRINTSAINTLIVLLYNTADIYKLTFEPNLALFYPTCLDV